MSKAFAILGRVLGGIAHLGEEVRWPIALGISNLIRSSLAYEPEKYGWRIGLQRAGGKSAEQKKQIVAILSPRDRNSLSTTAMHR